MLERKCNNQLLKMAYTTGSVNWKKYKRKMQMEITNK